MRSPSTSPENSPRECIEYNNDILFNNQFVDNENKYIRYRSPSPPPISIKYYSFVYFLCLFFLILYYNYI